MKIIKKIVGKIHLYFIKKINYISVKKYMKAYTRFLKSRGVDIHDYQGVGYIDPSAYIDNTDYSKIYIGKNVTISRDVIILTHDYSIWNALCSIDNKWINKRPHFIKNIKIGDNCFIGARSFILPGAELGNNVIVGSCSVVTKKIPDNVVIAGNPAKVIMTVEEFAKKHIKENDYIV